MRSSTKVKEEDEASEDDEDQRREGKEQQFTRVEVDEIFDDWYPRQDIFRDYLTPPATIHFITKMDRIVRLNLYTGRCEKPDYSPTGGPVKAHLVFVVDAAAPPSAKGTSKTTGSNVPGGPPGNIPPGAAPGQPPAAPTGGAAAAAPQDEDWDMAEAPDPRGP